MPIEFKKEGNACERCKKQDTEVGKITHYTKHGANLLLCPKCFEDRERPYTEKCPKCKRIAYEHGGLTYYDDSDVNDSNDIKHLVSDNYDGFNDSEDFDYNNEKPPLSSELMCLECHEKKVARMKRIRKAKLKIKNFAKDHWKFLISTFIAIVAIIVGLSRL